MKAAGVLVTSRKQSASVRGIKTEQSTYEAASKQVLMNA
jgi:hypothetical protein